jgi:ATP-binding cassette subfamily B protein
MKKRNFLNDAVYCLKDIKEHSKFAYVLFVSKVLLAITVPLLATITSSLVVYALSNNYSITSYLYLVLILAGSTALLEVLKILVDQRYQWDSTFARCEASWMRLTHKILSTDYDNIEPRDKRRLLNRGFEALDNNFSGIEGTMKEFPNFVLGALGMLVYGVLVGIYVPWVLLILAFMLISNILLSGLAYSFMEKTCKQNEINYERLYVLEKDTTDKENAKDIRNYRLQKWFIDLFDSLNKSFFLLEKKTAIRFLFSDVSDSVFLFVRDLVAYSLLIPLVSSGVIDISRFVFLIGIVAGFSTWINSFTVAYHRLQTYSVSVNDYRDGIALADSWPKNGKSVANLTKPISIRFEHVSFRYPSANEDSLKDINLEIKAGSKIALVGNNGAGKTTLVKLLCGLYRPTSGHIYLNDEDYLDFDHEEYYSLISAVFQDVEPLAFTILNNVTCSTKEDADMAKFQKAIKEAGLSKKIESLPQKEDTYISQTFDLKGVRLSGGETQKLLLARALYKNAPILLLDEPTAALDPLSEENMYKEYLSFATGNTSIFISHRLASTRFADQIIYLSNGQIEEEGSHEELLAKHGLYAETFALQAKYYKEAEEGCLAYEK